MYKHLSLDRHNIAERSVVCVVCVDHTDSTDHTEHLSSLAFSGALRFAVKNRSAPSRTHCSFTEQ